MEGGLSGQNQGPGTRGKVICQQAIEMIQKDGTLDYRTGDREKSWASSEIFRNKPNGTQYLTRYLGYTTGRNKVWFLG